MISARKAKQLDATTMFTYSHANTPLGQSQRAYYLSYFIKFHNNGSDSGLVYSLQLKLLGSFDCSIFAICGFLALEVRFYKQVKRNYFDNMSCIQEQQQILLPYDKSRLSLIVRVNVVLNRTVVVDND